MCDYPGVVSLSKVADGGDGRRKEGKREKKYEEEND